MGFQASLTRVMVVAGLCGLVLGAPPAVIVSDATGAAALRCSARARALVVLCVAATCAPRVGTEQPPP